MIHLYLFDEFNENAAVYGVGTYIRTLISCLPPEQYSVTVVKILYDKPEVREFRQGTVRFIYIPRLTPVTASRVNYYRSCAFILARWINPEEKVIFHFNYISCCDLAKYLKELFPLSRTFLTIHYRELKTSENIEKEKELVNSYCDRIIVLSGYAKDALEKEYYTSPSKIRIVYNGEPDQAKEYLADNIRKNLKLKYGFKEDDFILLYAGRIDGNKNPFLLIKVLAELSAKKSHLHLIIAGGGDIDSLLKECQGDFRYLHCTGRVSKNILNDLYTLADIGVIPSFYEEFSYVALEMAMFGVPVIANRTGGIPEVVEDGVSGKLLDMYIREEAYTVEAICQSICYWLDNSSERIRIRENARRRYLSKFTIEEFQKNMVALYREYV